jgi:hypothetical protein
MKSFGKVWLARTRISSFKHYLKMLQMNCKLGRGSIPTAFMHDGEASTAQYMILLLSPLQLYSFLSFSG